MRYVLALMLMLASPTLALAGAGDGPSARETTAAQTDQAAIDRLIQTTRAYQGWSSAARAIQTNGYGFGDSSCTCGPNVVAGW